MVPGKKDQIIWWCHIFKRKNMTFIFHIEMCFSVNYNFIIVIPGYICFSNVFLWSYSCFFELLFIVLVVFYKMLPSTTAIIRSLSLFYNNSNSGYIFCNKHLQAFLECYMYKDEAHLLTIKNLLFWGIDRSSFLHITIFFCTVFYLFKCNCNLLV